MRILVVRLGAFGDIIHSLPLAATLHQGGHELGWLCEDRWADLVVGNPAIATVHQLSRASVRHGAWSDRLAAAARTMRLLRAASYDAVIDAQGLAKSALFAAACGAPLRIGHDRPLAREGSWLVNRRRVPGGAIHVIDQQRSLAWGVGIEPAGPWRFPLPAWAEAGSSQGATSGPWMLNVGAGWPTKIWPLERQVELLRALERRQQPLVLLWGSAREQALAEQLRQLAGHGDLAPPTTIPQLGALLRRAALVISSDTGPLHLAFALGRPCVGLFGPVPAQRNGPCGQGQRSLQAPAAPWERTDLTKVDMGAISVADVLAAADAALAEARATARR